MLVLNPGRYVIGDPEFILDRNTLDRLFHCERKLDAITLKTSAGLLQALHINNNGLIDTSIDKKIFIQSFYIAFIPLMAAGRLLNINILRVTIVIPILIFIDSDNSISINSKLKLYL